MKVFSFGPRRRKRFLALCVLLFSVPFLALLPVSAIRHIVFIPLLFWINIVGFPLAALRVPGFEVHEFGAVPEGPAGSGMIALVYLLVAFLLSMLGPSEDSSS